MSKNELLVDDLWIVTCGGQLPPGVCKREEDADFIIHNTKRSNDPDKTRFVNFDWYARSVNERFNLMQERDLAREEVCDLKKKLEEAEEIGTFPERLRLLGERDSYKAEATSAKARVADASADYMKAVGERKAVQNELDTLWSAVSEMYFYGQEPRDLVVAKHLRDKRKKK